MSSPKQSAETAETSPYRYIAPVVGPDDERRITDSGIEIDRLYDARDVAPDLEERLGEPGSYPFTRGIHEGMYRDRHWTMRQYAGFSSPEDTNERYRYLIEHGSTGLSMAFDLPTQLGRDSDEPICEGEVGRTGVPIDTIEDMRICFDQIPLSDVSTSMTINAPASVLLLLYELVGEEQGVESKALRGTVQNDVLKEYMARGNYIYPPEPTMRLTTDIFEYCAENVPKWNTISISGYHIREKGCSAVQEVAFTLSNAIAYVEAALDRGLTIDQFAPRLAFFFNGHNNVFQEIAKFRAVRRMWAEIVRDRFGSDNPKSQMIRFHTQTGGVTLQAQQPEVNIIRVALQGFAAVCGGTQSLHTNGFDEALALPTERSARIALRTQQVLAYESGAADTVDPFAGSYFVESLTDEIELRAKELMEQVADQGGSVAALDFMQKEIEESAASYHERYKSGQDVIVGVNKFVTDTPDEVDILKVDPEAEVRQVKRLGEFKERRDQGAVDEQLRRAAGRRSGRRQHAAGDEGGAARQRLDRRGLRRAARGLRRVPRRRLLLGRDRLPPVSHRTRGRHEARLQWRSDDEFEIDGVAYACRPIDGVFPSSAERFCLRKPPELVRRIERLLADLQPRTIVEVGVFQGGSTGLLAQAGRPEKLVCIDNEHRKGALQGMLRTHELTGVVKPYWGIDQADVPRVREILAAEIGSTPIDLVIDDASHLLEPTRATFDTIFPQLRPRALYVIEDWSWAHGAFNAWPDVTPLTPLIFELIIAAAHRPEVITRVDVDQEWAVITRGPAELGADFTLRDQVGEFGLRLLPDATPSPSPGGSDVG